MFCDLSNKEFFRETQSVSRLRILENQLIKTKAANATKRPENFVGCSSLIGQEPCDVSI